MNGKSWAIGMLCALMLLSGCDELQRLNGLTGRQGSTISKYGDGPISRLRIHHGFRHRSILRRMQGDWVVSRGGRYLFELNVKGERATLIDHRYRVPRTLSGEISLRTETSFGIEGPDGVREYFSFLQTEKATYIGAGGAIALGDLEAPEDDTVQVTTEFQPFRAFLGAWETLEFDGTGCLLIERWMEDVNKREVACGFEEKKGRQVFHYQGRDRLRPERLKRYELEVVGGFLVEPELKRSVASRRSTGEVSEEMFEEEDNTVNRARKRARARTPKVAPNPFARPSDEASAITAEGDGGVADPPQLNRSSDEPTKAPMPPDQRP
jgi:hypothetical protein